MTPSKLAEEEKEIYMFAALRVLGHESIPDGMALLIHPCSCPGDRAAHEADPTHMAKHAVVVKGLATP